MLASVFTPSHDVRHLDDCYRSLIAQTHHDWEWIVVLNGAARWVPPGDARVRVVQAPESLKGVGALKRLACEHARGEVLVELDHDDVLLPRCLGQVTRTFADDDSCSLVYSDFALTRGDLSPHDERFDPGMGWQYSGFEFDGQTYLQCHAMAPLPHNLGYIWYSPNHVRAFRRDAYELVGGYRGDQEILDDQELMSRLWAAGDFQHLRECLYLQRMHERNTQSESVTNATIQAHTVALYHRTIEPLYAAWAERESLDVLELDIDLGDTDLRIDAPAGSVGLLRAVDVLQHVADRGAFFNECHRVLAHGGLLLTVTPSTDGRGAFADPSAVALWNESSFWYLTQEALRPRVANLTGRFQISHLSTWFPTPWHESVNIAEVRGYLLAVKDGPRLGGPLLC